MFKEQQTIPSAIVNDLQVGANPRLILLAVLMSKKVRGGEVRTSWKRLSNELGICRNSVPSLMETLRNRYQWVAFEKKGSWWHIKPGKGMRPTGSETAIKGLLQNDHDPAVFEPHPCCVSSPYTHPLLRGNRHAVDPKSTRCWSTETAQPTKIWKKRGR